MHHLLLTVSLSIGSAGCFALRMLAARCIITTLITRQKGGENSLCPGCRKGHSAMLLTPDKPNNENILLHGIQTIPGPRSALCVVEMERGY